MTVKADTMEPQLLRRYEMLQKQSVDISEPLVQISSLSQSFGALFSQAAVAATGLFGGYLVIVDQIGLAELAACMLLNGRTVQPLLKMLRHWAQTKNTKAARAKIEEIGALEQRETTKKRRTRWPADWSSTVFLRPDPGETRLIFSDVSFDLRSGAVLNVLAEAGSGSDTFMRLILGEEKPRAGKILLDQNPNR